MANGNNTENRGDESGDAGDDRSIPSIDPVEITAAAADNDSDGTAPLGYLPNGQPRQRRRRTKEQIAADRAAGIERPRTAIPGKEKSNPLSVNSIQFSLTGIHALLAAGFSAPELELTEAEAKTFSENIVAVARHYDLQQTQKATDIGNLVVSVGIIYGGRIIRISARKKAEAAQRRSAHTAHNAGVNAVASVVVPPPSPNSGNGSKPPPQPATRPKQDADLALLNEHEAYVA